jgi:hypothetical protein
LANSRFDLPNPTADRYFELAYEHIVGFLTAGADSAAAALDPGSDVNLKLARMVRRCAISDHSADHPDVLADMADAFFAIPSDPLVFGPQLQDAEFASGISLSVAAGRTLPAVSK